MKLNIQHISHIGICKHYKVSYKTLIYKSRVPAAAAAALSCGERTALSG